MKLKHEPNIRQQANYGNNLYKFMITLAVGFCLVCCVRHLQGKAPQGTLEVLKGLVYLSSECRKFAKESNDRLDKAKKESNDRLDKAKKESNDRLDKAKKELDE